MKFGYSYKTSDGLRHEAEITAKTREDVFSTLRAKGIRPIKVWEVHSKYYLSFRTRLLLLLMFVTFASIFYAIKIQYEISEVKTEKDRRSAPRHQIYGDPAIWESVERDNFISVFDSVGERLLAMYAIPGRLYDDYTFNLSRREIVKALEDCVSTDIIFNSSDSVEATELKKIVQGMKEDMRWYLGDGVGTANTYLTRLQERQQEEFNIRERARRELEGCTDEKLREDRNSSLRAMGLRTIPRREIKVAD